MCDTTDMEKLRILTMWECGKTTAEIAKSVNKSARTVQRWIAHQKREGNMAKKPRGLRPRKTTPEEDEKIIKLVRENPELTQKEILTICNLNIYKGTLRRRIQEANGIYKIDLFGKDGQVKKKGAIMKSSKKKTETTTTSQLPSIITATETTPAEILLVDPMESKPILGSAPLVSTEALLKTLEDNTDPVDDLNQQEDIADIKCLPYEDGNFHSDFNSVENAYEAVNDIPDPNDEDDDNLFDIQEQLKADFQETSEVLDEFTAGHTPVIVEILDQPSPIQKNKQVHSVLLEGEYSENVDDNLGSNIKSLDEAKVKEKITDKNSDKDGAKGNNMLRNLLQDLKYPSKASMVTTGKSRRVKTEVKYTEDEIQETYPKENSKKPRIKITKKKLIKGAKVKRGNHKNSQEKKETNWEKNRRDTTDIEKKKILIMAECGMTTEDIARNLKKSRRTVQRWLAKYQKGVDMDKKERGRRPRKTTPEEDAKIIQLVKENPTLSRRQILALANINLHKVTLKNRLNEAGLFFNSQGQKILDYTESQREKEGQPESKPSEHLRVQDDEESSTIITCTTYTPTPEITNAILSCPTLSTTLIIRDPNEPPPLIYHRKSHSGNRLVNAQMPPVNLQSESDQVENTFLGYSMY